MKAVISGDTLVLVGAATNGPPPELVLTLASLQAPRLARAAEQTNEVDTVLNVLLKRIFLRHPNHTLSLSLSLSLAACVY